MVAWSRSTAKSNSTHPRADPFQRPSPSPYTMMLHAPCRWQYTIGNFRGSSLYLRLQRSDDVVLVVLRFFDSSNGGFDCALEDAVARCNHLPAAFTVWSWGSVGHRAAKDFDVPAGKWFSAG